MGYKDTARNQVDSLIGITPYVSINSTSILHSELINLINMEIGSDRLLSIFDFIKEYAHSVECHIGYLFEPFGTLPNIKPRLQLTKKEKSPYFCAKFPVRGMGNIFVVPTVPYHRQEVALLLKPDRPYRLETNIGTTILESLPMGIFFSPYYSYIDYLNRWAARKEVALRK